MRPKKKIEKSSRPNVFHIGTTYFNQAIYKTRVIKTYIQHIHNTHAHTHTHAHMRYVICINLYLLNNNAYEYTRHIQRSALAEAHTHEKFHCLSRSCSSSISLFHRYYLDVMINAYKYIYISEVSEYNIRIPNRVCVVHLYDYRRFS